MNQSQDGLDLVEDLALCPQSFFQVWVEGTPHRAKAVPEELMARVMYALKCLAPVREGFYEKLWKDFVSVQRGDEAAVVARVERFYRENALTQMAKEGTAVSIVRKYLPGGGEMTAVVSNAKEGHAAIDALFGKAEAALGETP